VTTLAWSGLLSLNSIVGSGLADNLSCCEWFVGTALLGAVLAGTTLPRGGSAKTALVGIRFM
jgi:hypothetical protein